MQAKASTISNKYHCVGENIAFHTFFAQKRGVFTYINKHRREMIKIGKYKIERRLAIAPTKIS